MRPEAQNHQTVANSTIKTSAVEGVLKIMEASPLKTPAPLREKQPDEKRSKSSNREKHVFVSKW